jgi:hypothetical protein
MRRRLLKPLLAMNAAFVVMLITLGPRYGWSVMIIIGVLVSMLNMLAVRAWSEPPRS